MNLTSNQPIELPTLRHYQVQAIADTEHLRKEGKQRVMITCPTGAGKTTIAAQYVLDSIRSEKRCIFIAHRTELIEQAQERLGMFGIRAGIIKSGHSYRKRPVQVASIQTLTRRQMPEAEIIFIDEAHHAMSDMYRKVIDHYVKAGAFVVGLSATPYRMDGKGLGDIFEEMVAPISILDLIKQGYLCPPKYLSPDPSQLDLEGVGTKQKDGYKDYDADGMYSKHFGKAEVFAGLIDNYRKYADGSKTIIFNCNLAHSQRVVDAFNAAGYPAVHVDGTMDRYRRKRILQDFAAGRYTILCNVQLLTEGYDLPSIETVIVNRKTKSKALWVQMVGRGLRTSPGKSHAWIIDQGANVYEHGRVDAHETIALEQTAKKSSSGAKGASPVKECPSCNYIQFASASKCSDCGYEWPQEDKLNTKAIDFVEVDDAILETSRKKKSADLPAHLRYKPFDEMTMHELEIVRTALGYKPLWVVNKLRDRSSEHPRPWDMLEILTTQYASMLGYEAGWVRHALQMVARGTVAA